ncbi:helix-turn-helix domain-containing protein [Spirosoma spitsbergense]|uniref:helix-turn-helix domain-containing protein n=1 Tax=Spirosoma spitsbergense TaxID=431554 RepID=UPI00036BAC77|nr:hypothetical protein [Spirosoma spitsbergense]
MEAKAALNYVARPIKTEEQYDEAIALIDELVDAEVGTPELELLELVSILVHDYEQQLFPIGEIDPIDAIRYQMAELGVTTTEIADLVGGKSRLSELLNRKRPLSVRQVKALSSRLAIPADVLLSIA